VRGEKLPHTSNLSLLFFVSFCCCRVYSFPFFPIFFSLIFLPCLAHTTAKNTKHKIDDDDDDVAVMIDTLLLLGRDYYLLARLLYLLLFLFYLPLRQCPKGKEGDGRPPPGSTRGGFATAADGCPWLPT
jgi:hypothetical protein